MGWNRSARNEMFHRISTDRCRVGKRTAVTRTSMLVFCISNAFVAVACAEPSPTPNHIKSRISGEAVQSTAIAKVGYSKRRHILEIEFVNGAVYRYFDVPAVIHADLMSAESKARFYDLNIRKHYHSVLVRPRQTQKHPGNRHFPRKSGTIRQHTGRRRKTPQRFSWLANASVSNSMK